ncbi:hypothetical protein BGX38DRAFT_1266715 [Terfezia claveryi]|nr:hypothetical protein BGX38DRAFT_1266715 [Terfezia claveryi]
MPLPAYGAVGHAFVASRTLQILILLVTIGLTSHCISKLGKETIEAPGRLIGNLTISCFCISYAGISFILYIKSTLPLLLCAICDGCFFFAFLAISILFGENVSNLSCHPSDVNIPIPDSMDIIISRGLGGVSFNGKAGIVSRIVGAKSNLPTIPQKRAQPTYARMEDMSFGEWVRTSQRSCEMMRGAWIVGLVILVLFLVSMGSLLGMWCNLRKQREQERQNRESKIEDNIRWAA